MLAGLMGDSMIKETLKCLSRNNRWSYGVFWRLDQKNSLLTLQDVHCEEAVEDMMEDKLLHVHVMGQGVIGQAAFTKRHRWMFSDSHIGKDHFEFDQQFSAGIKTIVVISVEPLGVVLFGSTEKLEERLEFVRQTKDFFQSIQIVQGLASSTNEPFSSNIDTWDASELVASLISCQSLPFASPEFQYGDRFQDFMETDCSLANMTESFHSTFENQKVVPLVAASAPTENRLRISNTEAQVDRNGNESNVQSLQSDMVSGGFIELSASQCPQNCAWSNSTIQESPILNSVCNSDLHFDMTDTLKQIFRNRMSDQSFDVLLHPGEDRLERPSNLCAFEELSKIDFSKDLSRHCASDDFFHWFSSTTDQSNEIMTTTLTNEPSHVSEVVSLATNLREHHTPNIILDIQPSISVQSSVTNALSSAEKLERSDTFGIEKQFHCSGAMVGSKSPQCWEDIILPVEFGGCLDFKASNSDCILRQSVDSKLRTSNTLFSKLGLHKRLDEFDRGPHQTARSEVEDWLSSTAKRRKMDCPLLGSNEVTCLPEFLRNLSSVEPVYHLNSSNNFESKDKDIRSLEASSCVDDNCSIIATKTVPSLKKPEQPVKSMKKKAKPGTKPRPKDRQQIHDRLIELRELIPNGEKMSIDRLLHLTIKHLLFLQSVTRHSEMFQLTEETKSGMVQKENHNSSSGVTWACEVEDQTMICPLIVEDLRVPGQMLIEILCEEHGLFLEIVDVIRGFGLIILKGVMELRETKLWARFNVVAEENMHVTRHEIFTSLVQLLNLTGPAGFHKSESLDKAMNGKATLFSGCQQSALPLPVSLARVDA